MSRYVTKKTQGNTAWFTHDRFGMFIHFGLYSLAARLEWVQPMKKYRLKNMRNMPSFLIPICMIRASGQNLLRRLV